ncbi:cation diffusion facilitator family transporter [Georgenia subflava]|uniref:Cation diffusion facilitator family transporter n=1 Tax=Georgenia subflava TaxID=1622177 RepID=A0A6N7EIT0_9MICO|nr:cation diffusion facilitator family transporter [Georgenia subflava]MPV38059.1 cation diffusion facilitator family transporter [Georgenia subflava]
MASGGTKAVITALFANLGIAIAKFVGYLLTGSSSMLAESVHSVADTSNQALLLIGGRRARRKASSEHQFGYGRVRYVYAFIVSIVLFSLGGLFALYEAWHKFSDPHPIDSWQWVPITVLLLAMVMEGFALRTAVIEANHVRGKMTLFQFVKASRAPEIPTILLEDTGALLGLVFGLFGVGMTLATGDGRWDAVGSAAIGVLLVVIAVFLAREMMSMLVGESALPHHQHALRNALPGQGVDRVIYMRTMHLGPDDVLVAAKVSVPRSSSAEQIADAIDAAEVRLREAVPLKLHIYLEPDLYSQAEAAAGPDLDAPAGPDPDAPAGPDADAPVVRDADAPVGRSSDTEPHQP